ncbi:DAK2 domain-containing protein [Psychrobacillus antarcticus]|uniref:DAK2 domain-containing protein n=1 Tax=Psychrobacillus antarcticus TaxID=2879115 RepID=UPI0024077A28|nr:DegV family protein [Psychrobacillus antarcticus]
MTVLYLNSEKLYFGFLAGAREVIKQKNDLNKINVFPVADGDTGTNLAFTMHAIIEEAQVQNSAKKTMETIADAALVGARGNSGIIFAQFINGLYMGLEDKEEISIKGFSHSVTNAVLYAHKAISNPVEGTMITVMRDWANSLDQLKDLATDFSEVFSKSMIIALRSLKDTPNKLKVLKDASVVDSGAKGFVHFLEGFGHFIQTGKSNESQSKMEQNIIQIENAHTHDSHDLSHRYCTEALVKGNNLDLDQIRLTLSDLGDSLIVAGNENKMRIHIHTNTPADLFHRLKNFGQIIQQKADDMQRQYEAGHARKHKIALVTDSIADIPKELMDKHQIHMIPLNLIVDDSNYLDKLTISPNYLYELMNQASQYPTSSQPTRKAASEFLNFVSTNYDSIIVVTVSKQMSGTFETITTAAQALQNAGKKIAVIDSKSNSAAQGLIVLKAAEFIEEGKSFEEVVYQTEKAVQNTKIFVHVKTLKYMVRSGRINKITGWAGKLLNLKPVVSIDEEGKGIIIRKALSNSSSKKKMEALVKEIAQTKNISNYSIVHADAEEQAGEYAKVFASIIGKEPTYITNISSIVAMNAGVGCVAIGLTTE